MSCALCNAPSAWVCRECMAKSAEMTRCRERDDYEYQYEDFCFEASFEENEENS
jgi:hypothetical protein